MSNTNNYNKINCDKWKENPSINPITLPRTRVKRASCPYLPVTLLLRLPTIFG